MTTPERLQKLLNLAEVSQELDTVDLKLVDHWCELREEYGLAMLLLMLRDHVKAKTTQG